MRMILCVNEGVLGVVVTEYPGGVVKAKWYQDGIMFLSTLEPEEYIEYGELEDE